MPKPIMLNLFKKHPTTPRPLIISPPILMRTEDYDNYHTQDNEKTILPPRPNPSPQSRILILTYGATTIISLTAIILFSIAIPLWNKNFIHRQSPIQTDWPDTLILIPLTLSFISTTYILVKTLLQRRRHHHHHHNSQSKLQAQDPFNQILLSTTILLSLIPSLILSANNALAKAFSALDAKSSSTSLPPNPKFTNTRPQTCNLGNIFTRPCLPIIYRIGELQVGGIILSSLPCLTWFVILIWSTHRFIKRRAEERRRRREERIRRRRKHGRRRGHEHRRGHDDGYKYKQSGREGSHGSHGSSRDYFSNSTSGTESFGRNESNHPHAGDRYRPKATSPPFLEGSNAVRYVQHKVRPKESIQTWLADRQI